MEERLCTFNPLMLEGIGWSIEPVTIDLFGGLLKQVADDFLLVLTIHYAGTKILFRTHFLYSSINADGTDSTIKSDG